MQFDIHKISSDCQEIATFFNLKNAHEFTGHCLRRTSTTLLVDGGGDITSLKRHGGCLSSSVAEGYIEDSFSHKEEVARKILRHHELSTNISSSTSTNISTSTNENKEESIANEKLSNINIVSNSTKNINNKCTPLIKFANCTNCTFNINIKN